MSVSSGTSAISITDTNSHVAVTLDSGSNLRKLRIINETTNVGGFWSIDGGTVWHRIPIGPSVINETLNGLAATVLVKGNGLTSLFVSVHQARRQ